MASMIGTTLLFPKALCRILEAHDADRLPQFDGSSGSKVSDKARGGSTNAGPGETSSDFMSLF
jgi:hypothetical protein